MASVQSTLGLQSGTLNIDWNADDKGTHRFEFAKDGNGRPLGLPAGLSSGGTLLDFVIEHVGGNERLVVFKVGDPGPVHNAVFTVDLVFNASYVFTLSQPLDHTGANEASVTLAFTINAIDGDGDLVPQPLTINVTDDTPTVGSASGTVIESTSTASPNAFIAASASGTLAISWGADSANPNSGLNDRSVAFDTSLNGPSGLFSNGDAITYTLSVNNTVLTATATNNPSTSRARFSRCRSTISSTATTPSTCSTISIMPRRPPARVITTRRCRSHSPPPISDGDSTPGTLTVHVTDDIPVVTAAAGQTGNVSEDPLPTVQATSGNLNIDWNADDRGSSHLEFARDPTTTCWFRLD